ncbi:alpha/beta fold hydrolase [Photobacterium leiognathi]|uniref:alpha/beta fold hydrolase n=1 Tax=Photobacterium leiognathi TaxID=553611 RepID=UPI00273886D1|nr:alpha/beta fold hydrolase [Photobacterium leiognathi]
MDKIVVFLLLILTGCAATPKDKDFEEIIFYVPKDYNNMSSGKIKLNAMIHRAKDKKNRIGLLVLNFGGPGGEAVESASQMISEKSFPQSIIDRFDILAIDPRGTGKSEFISDLTRCSFNSECDSEKESVGFNISTMKFTQDIDYIRKSLNEDKITFLGYSYGTKIGQLYSFLYPQNIRGVVLDSPTSIEHGNAIEESMTIPFAYERIMYHRLSKSEIELIKNINNKIKEYEIYTTKDGYKIDQDNFNKLLETIISMNDDDWSNIKPSLISFLKTEIFYDYIVKIQEIESSNSNDSSDSSLAAAIASASIGSINCSDENKPLLDSEIENSLSLFERKSSLFGSLAYKNYYGMCLGWKAKRDPLPYISKVNNRVPILIIGGKLDNLTPYEEAIKVDKMYLGNKKLITVNNIVSHSFSFSYKDDYVDYITEKYLLNPNYIIDNT